MIRTATLGALALAVGCAAANPNAAQTEPAPAPVLIPPVAPGAHATEGDSDSPTPPSSTEAGVTEPHASESADAGPEERAPAVSGGGTLRVGHPGGAVQPGYMAMVASMRGSFRRCFARAAAQGHASVGGVRIRVDVGPSGTVVKARATSSGSLNSGLRTCLEARAATMHFGPPQGGSAIIMIPLTYSP